MTAASPPSATVPRGHRWHYLWLALSLAASVAAIAAVYLAGPKLYFAGLRASPEREACALWGAADAVVLGIATPVESNAWDIAVQRSWKGPSRAGRAGDVTLHALGASVADGASAAGQPHLWALAFQPRDGENGDWSIWDLRLDPHREAALITALSVIEARWKQPQEGGGDLKSWPLVCDGFLYRKGWDWDAYN